MTTLDGVTKKKPAEESAELQAGPSWCGVASRSRCKRLRGGGSFVVVMLGDGADGFGLFGGGSGRWAQRCGWLEELAA